MEVEPASDDWGYELVTHRIVPPTMCDSKGVTDMATQDTGGIKELRDAADRGREAMQERDQLKREMAFMKAGVDTDSKAGQLLFKAYDGELDTEAIQAEWQELAPTPSPVVYESINCFLKHSFFISYYNFGGQYFLESS